MSDNENNVVNLQAHKRTTKRALSPDTSYSKGNSYYKKGTDERTLMGINFPKGKQRDEVSWGDLSLLEEDEALTDDEIAVLMSLGYHSLFNVYITYSWVTTLTLEISKAKDVPVNGELCTNIINKLKKYYNGSLRGFSFKLRDPKTNEDIVVELTKNVIDGILVSTAISTSAGYYTIVENLGYSNFTVMYQLITSIVAAGKPKS